MSLETFDSFRNLNTFLQIHQHLLQWELLHLKFNRQRRDSLGGGYCLCFYFVLFHYAAVARNLLLQFLFHLLKRLQYFKKIQLKILFCLWDIMKIKSLTKKYRENSTLCKEHLYNQYKFLLKNTKRYMEQKWFQQLKLLHQLLLILMQHQMICELEETSLHQEVKIDLSETSIEILMLQLRL